MADNSLSLLKYKTQIQKMKFFNSFNHVIFKHNTIKKHPHLTAQNPIYSANNAIIN